MSALKNYCDKIYEYICQYGEDYIWHIGWKSEPMILKQDHRRDHKQETKEYKVIKRDPKRLKRIGKKCFDARQECFNEIEKDLILCGTPKAKERYAKLVIEDMSYITLNHPIAQYDKFKSVVQHDVFGPILGLFKNENINISPFLDIHRELGKDLLSFFMSDENEIIDSEKKREQTNFKDIFFPEYKEHIPDFIKRLEDRRIIKDGIFNHRKKNHLAKLICYMQDKKIIKKDCDHISLARSFYGFFGKKVEEKAGENIVTISNVRKTLRIGIEGLSEEEKSDFDLICSIFISRRE